MKLFYFLINKTIKNVFTQVLKGYSSNVDWQTRYYFKDLERDCLAEIALYFNKTNKDITEHIAQWKYDFLTATYFVLLFMKMNGKPPKIKSNMKKYSQFITFANCTTSNATLSNTSSSLQPQSGLSNTISHTTNNRVLVEKQLASLSTNGNTPKIGKPPAKNGNAVMNNVKNCTKAGGNTVTNENHDHVSTPHTKNQLPNNNKQVGQSQTSKTPKALFFDEIKVKLRSQQRLKP